MAAVLDRRLRHARTRLSFTLVKAVAAVVSGGGQMTGLPVEIEILKQYSRSSRLNARTLRKLAVDEHDGEWIRARAEEIDAFAEQLDQEIEVRSASDAWWAKRLGDDSA